MVSKIYPVLEGDKLFRKNELVHINKSNELIEFCGIIHKHDFIEIAYVISGTGTHVVGENRYEFSPGDLFIINYDTPHGFFANDKYSEDTIVYNCIFRPEFLDSSLLNNVHFQDITASFLFRSLFEEHRPNPDLKLLGTDFNEIGELFTKMYKEYKTCEKGYIDIIRAYLIELLIKTFRHLDSDKNKSTSHHNRNLVNQAIIYLNNNFNTDVKLEDLAMKSFLSKNYFSRLFKEVAGIRFSDYVQKLRITEACSLLKNSDMKIIDISAQVGFKDIKFFYEVFKKITGKTPSDFRK